MSERRSELGGSTVSRLVGDAQQERREARHTRDRSWDREKRMRRYAYDLPDEVGERVKEIAEELSDRLGARVPVYDVARLLLEAGIRQYEAGELDEHINPVPHEVRLFPKG